MKADLGRSLIKTSQQRLLMAALRQGKPIPKTRVEIQQRKLHWRVFSGLFRAEDLEAVADDLMTCYNYFGHSISQVYRKHNKSLLLRLLYS